jgi:hypothetical protein
MISRHHYPNTLPGEARPTWEQNPTPDDYTRIAAALDAEDAADRANGVDVWDRVFPPPAPGVCDCDEPLVITGQGGYRREVREDEAGGMFTATFMVCLAMIGALGLLGLGLWAGGAL